ncbi:hypothetical protein ZIOFF_067949 [Zingiber officinale]|uniref:Nuclease HARBI1 n=1 Tax=Zingiber officinale TaxID=94328 RepID=A0A8J5CE18_ZINOF|nr:hypothetical protein ZIOFF_067949 [Zingiber officinale]
MLWVAKRAMENISFPLIFPIETQVRIILACCLLHNLIRKYMSFDPQELVPLEEDDMEDEHFEDDEYVTSITPTEERTNFRNTLALEILLVVGTAVDLASERHNHRLLASGDTAIDRWLAVDIAVDCLLVADTAVGHLLAAGKAPSFVLAAGKATNFVLVVDKATSHVLAAKKAASRVLAAEKAASYVLA